MNTKISVFLNFVKAIKYLLLYNLHDCTFNISLYLAKALDFYVSIFTESGTSLFLKYWEVISFVISASSAGVTTLRGLLFQSGTEVGKKMLSLCF